MAEVAKEPPEEEEVGDLETVAEEANQAEVQECWTLSVGLEWNVQKLVVGGCLIDCRFCSCSADGVLKDRSFPEETLLHRLAEEAEAVGFLSQCSCFGHE